MKEINRMHRRKLACGIARSSQDFRGSVMPELDFKVRETERAGGEFLAAKKYNIEFRVQIRHADDLHRKCDSFKTKTPLLQRGFLFATITFISRLA